MENSINRREFIKTTSAITAGILMTGDISKASTANKPNVLYIMTDQQRFDTIAALGNSQIYTPNMDRLVKRGVTFTNCYSSCAECVPARYTIRTGCEPPKTLIYGNAYLEKPAPGQAETIEGRCGAYLMPASKVFHLKNYHK